MVIASSIKPIGRIDFVLRLVLISALAVVFALLSRGDWLSHPYSSLFQKVFAFGLVGIFVAETIRGRLLDAGLPRWYGYPAIIVWLLSTSLLAVRNRAWPIGLILFTCLLSVGGLLVSKPMSAMVSSAREVMKVKETAPVSSKEIQERLLVSPVGFLRCLLSFACLWLPLICLDRAFGVGVGVWAARFGYLTLGIVWLIKVFGRLADAGRSPKVHQWHFALGLILLIRILRQWRSNPSFIEPMMPLWLKHINGYEILALLLLIQIPLALLPSKQRPTVPEGTRRGAGARTLVPMIRIADPSLSASFRKLRPLLVIACLWIPLIYTDNASGGNLGTWLAYLGYVILGFSWLVYVHSRLNNAGLADNLYPQQYALVVSVASLMPLAVHWVNGYGALAIFVVVQTPIVLLRSKVKEPSPKIGEHVA
jgi:hypothetical protein